MVFNRDEINVRLSECFEKLDDDDFGKCFKKVVEKTIESIRSQEETNGDEFHRQTILSTFELFSRYLNILENRILHVDSSKSKKMKISQTNYQNERDEILHLFTNFLQLDLRQFWHENERLEDQPIGNTMIDVCLTIIRNNQYSSRIRTVKDYLSFILAMIIGLFRIEEETSLKMIQMLQIQEHPVTIFSATVVCHVKHFRSDSLLERIVADICHQCLSINSVEHNASRTMAKFLDELSIHLADHLVNFIERLFDLFDSDCLQMRNSLLNLSVAILRSFSSSSEYKNLRTDLFNLIIDQYFLDSNVHVRSHAIDLCQKLTIEKQIPTKFFCHLSKATIERTNDTSCIVRKHALQLLSQLLEKNPYADRFLPIDLMLDEYNDEMNKLIRLQKLLGQVLTIENETTNENRSEQMNVDDQHILFERILEQKQRIAALFSSDESFESFDKYNEEMSVFIQLQSKLNHCLSTNVDVIDDEEPIEKATRLFDQMVKQSKLVSYLHNATEFYNLLRRFLAKDAIYLLSSKVNSDVLEMIEFLVLWSNFECQSKVYKNLEKQMFALIWSKDKTISSAVINAFKRICLKFDEEKSSKEIIVKLLDQIDSNLTVTFEEILKSLFNDESNLPMNQIASFVDLLIDYYLKLTIDQTKKHLSDEFFIEIQQRECSFLQLIAFVVPFDRKKRLNSQISSIFQNLHRQIETKSLNFLRYQMKIISNLRTNEIISSEFFTSIRKKFVETPTEISIWINAMKEFFELLFLQSTIDEKPMKFLRILAERIQWTNVSSIDDSSIRIDLIRLFASINAFLTHRVEQYSTSNEKIRREKSEIDQDDDEEIPMAKPILSDLSQLEEELFQSDSLFSQVDQWIENFIRQDLSNEDEQLVLTSLQTCTRMMYVSSSLATKYVDRIFELSKISQFSSVRSALIVALGDLLLRHPNIVEPFTPQFYSQIHDKDLSVSETALSTIAILILREMIKIRGYISEIALCLFHSHPPISSIAQHFFDELSLRQRGLALFNVLPDIISRLSMNNVCSNEIFQQIISYLFAFIKNDRHCEILVKRLCRQFKQACGDDRKRANIAFCLSKLNIKTMSSYKILQEYFPKVEEKTDENLVDYDEDEHLAWKKYLMPVLNEIERRLKPNEVNSSRRLSSNVATKRKSDR